MRDPRGMAGQTSVRPAVLAARCLEHERKRKMKTSWIYIAMAQIVFTGVLSWDNPQDNNVGQSIAHPESGSAVIRPEGKIADADTAATLIQETSFHWSQVESPDYHEYVRNLRRIGCPETTLRDIVRADLQQAFQQQRASSMGSEPVKFWQAGFGSSSSHRDPPAESTLEENTALQKLLGTSGDQEGSAELPFHVGGVLWAKKDALRDWWERFESQRESVLEQASGRELSEQERQQLQELELSKDQDLDRLLTPEEREQFEWRNSGTAEAIRSNLAGVEINEAEFRALFLKRKDFEERLSGLTDGGAVAAQIHEQFRNEALHILGPERFSKFDQAEDPEFQDIAAHGRDKGWDEAMIVAEWNNRRAQSAEADSAQIAGVIQP